MKTESSREQKVQSKYKMGMDITVCICQKFWKRSKNLLKGNVLKIVTIFIGEKYS